MNIISCIASHAYDTKIMYNNHLFDYARYVSSALSATSGGWQTLCSPNHQGPDRKKETMRKYTWYSA